MYVYIKHSLVSEKYDGMPSKSSYSRYAFFVPKGYILVLAKYSPLIILWNIKC